jgi:putative RNA 2'-phosphotransferase
MSAGDDRPDEGRGNRPRARAVTRRPEDVRRSRLLSRILRHEPERAGVVTDPAARVAAGLPALWDGWVPVTDVLAAGRRLGVRFDLPGLVRGSAKQRFALSDDGRLIRANQGHSVPVDLGLEPLQPPEVLYHGTGRGQLAAIRREGLRAMGRHAVHLSPDVATARVVGSRRAGPVVVLAVDAAGLHAAGQPFTRSANGVWLTSHVPPDHLTVVEGNYRSETIHRSAGAG